jgi:hypothetical protein
MPGRSIFDRSGDKRPGAPIFGGMAEGDVLLGMRFSGVVAGLGSILGTCPQQRTPQDTI